MDYLSELLESYSKLKKRTFKLTYICEQDDPEAEGALTKILQNAPQTPGYEQSIEDPNYPGLKSFKYRKTADGGVSVLSPKDGQATVLDSGGNRATVNAKGQPNKAGDKMWERLFQAMSGKGDEPSASDQVGDNIEAQQQQAEAERLSKLAQPGVHLRR